MRSIIIVSLLCCLTTTSVFAIVAAEVWIDIPVVVNIIDSSDSSNVDAAIEKANEILEQANIRLVVKKTNQPFDVGDGDGDLDKEEGDEALEDGQEELNSVCGAGKGIKITIADDVWIEESNTNGWAIHRNPVVFVEPDADVNVMGETLAHEICHSLTLVQDLNDIGDINELMYAYTDRGTHLGPDDINEIQTTARRRGYSYFIMPRVLPGQSVAVPMGYFPSIDARGAILDGFYDQYIFDTLGIVTGPNDPTITYTDLREITLFANEPHDPNSFISLEIQLGGLIPEVWEVNSFFDVFFEFNDSHSGFDAKLHIELFQTTVIGSEIIDLNNLSAPAIPVDTVVHRNDKFDVNGTHAVGNNHSLQSQIPIELVELQLISAVPITIQVDSQFTDLRIPVFPIQTQDSTNNSPDSPFLFGLDLPCSSPGLFFSGGSNEPNEACGDDICFEWDLHGCGFTAGGDVEIEIDGVTTLTTTANADGHLMVSNIGSSGLDGVSQELAVLPHYHWVIAKEVDDSGPQGAKHAIGFFSYIPNGSIIGDNDWDGDVDWFDLGLSANNWLVGTE